MFLQHAFCSHCRKLDEIPTATEHACYKVQSNVHAHKRYNMPSTRIPYQIWWRGLRLITPLTGHGLTALDNGSRTAAAPQWGNWHVLKGGGEITVYTHSHSFDSQLSVLIVWQGRGAVKSQKVPILHMIYDQRSVMTTNFKLYTVKTWSNADLQTHMVW